MAQEKTARKPGDPFAVLHGRKIAIENVAGAFRSCRNCGHTLANISTTPVGMHQGHLTCASCGSITSYLSREHLQAMLAAHSANVAEGKGAA